MAYADYHDYICSFWGTAVPEEEWPRLSMLASHYIDYITQGRAAARADEEAVKLCCCALAEQYRVIEAARAAAGSAAAMTAGSTGAEKKSETVGSWSATYRGGDETAVGALQLTTAAQQALADIARQYLYTTGLLYRGRGCAPCTLPTL